VRIFASFVGKQLGNCFCLRLMRKIEGILMRGRGVCEYLNNLEIYFVLGLMEMKRCEWKTSLESN
jgi:hypothetical protein